MLALVDGDVACFRAGAVVERDCDGIVDAYMRDACVEKAKQNIMHWLQPLQDPDILVVFSGAENFRKRLLGNYKSNRDPSYRPTYLPEIKEAMEAYFDCETLLGAEADDVIAMRSNYTDTAIVSVDKDFAQMPGTFLHWNNKGDYKLREITFPEALHNLAVQWLMGDSTDGLTGIPKIGPKKAEALVSAWGPVATVAEVISRGVQEYHAKGLSEDYAMRQYYCIRLVPDLKYWDSENNQPTYIPEELYELDRQSGSHSAPDLQPTVE